MRFRPATADAPRWRALAASMAWAALALTGCGGGTTATPAQPAITVSLSSGSVSLAGGQAQMFTATVANDATNAGVTWSIGAGAGTLSSLTATGATYTAPAVIASASSVTLTATSKTDTTKSATATITLNPIAVSLNTNAISLMDNGFYGFTATIANDPANAGVTWSIGTGAGSLGSTTILNTTYFAPAAITAVSTVTLTATSKTDPTKSTMATITLNPISVSLSPTSTTLAASASQAFTATVANDTANAGVTWSIGTGPGTLSGSSTSAVTYTAPAGLPAATTVTLTATSKTDATKNATATITLTAPAAPASQWVYYNASGNLAYKQLDTQGDQIMDFSTAGYMQGAAAIPTATVQANVSPSGDTTGATDTTNIQNAINTVSAMTLNTTTGLRGAVLLAAGNYYVNGSLTITASGVVLRGSGSGTSGGTVITAVAATTPYPLVILGSSSTAPSYAGSATTITDSYVAAGTTTLDVTSTSGLSVGSTIMIQRPVTQNWINYMGMTPANLGTTCSGSPCSWISVGNSSLKTDRTITAISGNKITLDAPMSDSIDSTYCGVNGGTVQGYTFTGRISQVGVENLREVAPVPANNLVPPTASYQLVVTYAVINAWIRNLTAQDTLQSIDIEGYSKQVTVSNVAITHTVTQTASAQFMEFYISQGTQVLMDTVSTTADNMYFFATSSATQGPNVLRNGSFTGNLNIEPHQRWATGLLVENTTVSADSGGQGAMEFINRGDYGTGQGWSIGWGVVWNSSAKQNAIQQPPGSMNWCIGCMGTQITQVAPGGSTAMPQGDIDSQGTYVYPTSLYQAQLTQRLGH